MLAYSIGGKALSHVVIGILVRAVEFLGFSRVMLSDN